MSDAPKPTTWRDRLIEVGSFRGISFLYDSVESEIGRRTALKEFPGRDQPFVEDLGLATRRFTIEMFVVGPNYDSDRDALRQALEQPGPGILDHPYWGAGLTVTVDGKVRIRETTKEGGMARFTVTFIEAGAQLRAVLAFNTAAQVTDAAEKVAEVGESRFAAIVSVVGAISGVIEAGVEAVQAVATTLNKVRGKIAAVMQVIDDVQAAITDISNTAAELLATPQVLANKITSLTDTIVGSINQLSDAVQALKDFFGDGEETVPSAGNALLANTKVNALARVVEDFTTTGSDLPERATSTPTQQQIADNQAEIIRLCQVAGAVSVAKTAVKLKFDNVAQAEEVRELTLALIDEILLGDIVDELYSVLVDLRAALAEHLSQAASELPELTDYVPGATAPALVLAYQLYGDPAMESEILVRNPQIRDPSALPSGQAIQVLNND